VRRRTGESWTSGWDRAPVLLVTSEGHIHHEFHQLPLLPPAALLFGWQRRQPSTVVAAGNGGAVAGRVGSAVALLIVALLSFQYSGVVPNFFRPDRLDMTPIEAGRAIEAAVDPRRFSSRSSTRSTGTTRPSCCTGRTGGAGVSTDVDTPQSSTCSGGIRRALLRHDDLAGPVGGHPDLLLYLRTRAQVPLPALRAAP